MSWAEDSDLRQEVRLLQAQLAGLALGLEGASAARDALRLENEFTREGVVRVGDVAEALSQVVTELKEYVRGIDARLRVQEDRNASRTAGEILDAGLGIEAAIDYLNDYLASRQTK